MKDLLNGASLIQRSVFGKKNEYQLKFNHEEDGCWYVDFPGWPFDHHNLMMVAGADDLCAFLSDDDRETRLNVIPAKKRETHDGYAELRRLDHSLTGGAHYEVKGIDGFTKNIWICPVTLFVLGNYPAYIYLKKTAWLKQNNLFIIERMKQKIFNLIVLDASGSMYSIRNEAVAGVVETIQTIRTAQDENANQEHLLSLVVFNGKRINTVYDRMPITKVPDFTKNDYQTTDNTPLYDAMGNAITNLQRYIDNDDNVLVTIITDGYENASVEWNHQRVFQLVEDLKKKNWLFTYIGANQDALEVAKSMGINHSMNYMSDAEGTKEMFRKEQLSRKAFYSKLSAGKNFYEAKSEDYFVDDDPNDENA